MERDQFFRFEKGMNELGISLSDRQEGQFLLYYELLLAWNRRMNLTAITAWEDVVEKHFLDSLCLVKAVPDPADRSVIDVGTGAGFPGIPLKIAFPGLDVLLVDSVGKKLRFLDEVIGELGLMNVTAIQGRAEDLAHEAAYRERFDLAVSRAVSNLTVLAEYCLPFVRIGGSFIAYKSADAEAECENAKRAISLLGGETERILRYPLPGTENARSLVCVKKREGTPRGYPRKAGTPAKKPLFS